MTQANSEKTSNVFQEIWRNGQLAWRLYTDRRVSTLLKLLVPAAALAYFVLPIDLLPDFIPIVGQLDEVAIILLLVRLFIALAPPEVVAEYQGEMAGAAADAPGGAPGQASRDGKASGAGRESVIDADFRVVNDG